MSRKLTAKLQQIKVKNLVLLTNWKGIFIEPSSVGKLLSKKGLKSRLQKKEATVALFRNRLLK